MADISQAVTETSFESEEARLAAIDALDERDPENELKLDAIMAAEIKEKSEADDNTPATSEPETVGSQEPTTPEASVEPQRALTVDEIIQIKKSELPGGFDTPGKLFKSYNEAQELIERQQRFIKEKLAGGGDASGLQAALEKSQRLEAELAEIRKKVERPAQQETRQENLSEIPESKATEIKQTRQRLQELSSDPITNEDEINKLRLHLDGLWEIEHERSSIMVQRVSQRAEAAEKQAKEAHATASGYAEKNAEVEKRKQAQDALLSEYKAIDSFMGNQKYPEFRMTKPSAEVERDYATWAKEVTDLYYGTSVNINTERGRQAMAQAMKMLKGNAPDITEKCRVAGVATTPSEDVKKYLEICDLLDYRDGYRVNPATGAREVVMRYHPPTQQMVPDAFPTLDAAYEDRKIRDGYYEKKIRDAFSKGGESMASAIQRRDSGAVEMDTSSGASSRDAGLTMSKEEAMRAMEEIDEIDAMRRKKSGDPAMWNRLNEAFRVMGQSPLE